MRSLRYPLVALILLVLGARSAVAQHCHIPEVDPSGRWWWVRASASVSAGSTDLVGEPRDYQGLGVAVQGGADRYSGRVALPAYRIASEGTGLGDVSAAASIDVLPRRALPRAGVTGLVTLPTGDADPGRGMGHTMVSGGVWARLMYRGAVFGLGAMYARALGDNAEHVAHQHGGSAGWPLVDPMNPSELMIDASAIVAVVPEQLRAGVMVAFAEPVDLEGERRMIGSAVFELLRGPYTVGVQVAAPLIGDPFTARGVVELAYRY